MSQMDIEEIKKEVIRDIEAHAEWREEVRRGKMFGVLIVEDTSQPTSSTHHDLSPNHHPSSITHHDLSPNHQHPSSITHHDLSPTTHYLKAYSGQICGRSDWKGYVPAIFDYLQEDGYFKQHEAEITEINKRVTLLQRDLPKGKRSYELDMLKAERRERSNVLQRWLFSQFMLRGGKGEERSVLDVFSDYATAHNLKQQLPPGGTGECCAPKLLHYANSKGLKPLELMEFWYGDPPMGEIRHHGQCYEPCQAKCVPVLWYLMPEDGMKIHGTRMTLQEPVKREITEGCIIYEDPWFVAINKPEGLLSVPGKRNLPNAQDMLSDIIGKRRNDGDEQSAILNSQSSVFKSQISNHDLKMTHRLDMDTSGVLLAAKTEEAFVAMQRLFAQHEKVRKEYIALLSNGISETKGSEGTISIPLAPDFLNRPRQMVDYENGKEAVTRYEILHDAPTAVEGTVMVRLSPLTGRTHQLRMHCAHQQGLGAPILGDPLYGNVRADRMFLHAERLTFEHPFTHEIVTIVAPAGF